MSRGCWKVLVGAAVVGGVALGGALLGGFLSGVGRIAWADEAAVPGAGVATSPASSSTTSPATAHARGAGDGGALPVGADGKALNTDFETGDLRDWTVRSGDAFAGQPVKGDAVRARRPAMSARHAGQFWIGTYEVGQDGPRGILESEAFEVTHPFAKFLVGGGAHDVGVDLILADGADAGKLFFHATGDSREEMEAVVVDLRAIRGRRLKIRVNDDHSFGWGHVNFDDFRFYSEEPKVPRRVMLTRDAVPNAGLTPEEAVRAMSLPPGFKATLFAGEPDVHQPVALAIDDRGRLWVAEAHTYPIRAREGQGKDNIFIFDDADGDGTFDKKTLFASNLNLVSGIEVGFGGVFVGAAPYLLFIPDADGDDRADGEPQVLLDGWAYQDTHETLNAFNWGPDGWLYGCHGVFTHSLVGTPGTPRNERVPINAGVWRFHPQTRKFEVFAEGSSNPWGVDFDDRGQAFITACVIPHLFHVIQGARYHRQAGQHFDPNVYHDIKTIADHVHWVGEGGPHAGNEKSGAAGGGHAHCGAMIYLGSGPGAWPAEYRNSIVMANIHGNRLNRDELVARGSGFVATHAADPVLMNDKWSRPISFKYGPDGAVYLIDWYDKQACHNPINEIWDRTNGRIFRIAGGGDGGATDRRSDEATKAIDLQKLSDERLVELQSHENDWFVRHARRILQERRAGTRAAVRDRLVAMLAEQKQPTKRLRALWALHASGGLSKQVVLRQFEDADPHVRAWAIQLAAEPLASVNITRAPFAPAPAPDGEAAPGSAVGDLYAKRFTEMAAGDASPVVRLYLASALQRLPPRARWAVLEKLVARSEDAQDANLPLMYWYAAEPAVAADPQRGIELAKQSRIPLVQAFVARRLCALATAGANGDPAKVKPAPLDLLADLLADPRAGSDDAALRKHVLAGMSEGLRGWQSLPSPKSWDAVYEKLLGAAGDDEQARGRLQALSVTFGQERALASLRETVADARQNASERRKAVEALVGARDAKVVPLLHALIGDVAMRSTAIRGLAAFDHETTPDLILGAYDKLDTPTKVDALNTLAARASYAKVLMSAVQNGRIAKADVTAATLRQLAAVDDAAVKAWVEQNFGLVRQTPQEKLAEIAQWKELLEPKAVADAADPIRGRAVFARTCQQCHALFDTGGKVGPDLTGSNRSDLGYVLTNVVDPSAVIGRDYQLSILKTRDKRVLSGIVRADDGNAVTLQTESELLTVPRSEITLHKVQPISMMPEGLLAGLKRDEVRDLVAYLGSARQVPMLATPQNQATLFNGKDLSGWSGEATLWRVEPGEGGAGGAGGGEIVGRTPPEGLKRNEFLFSEIAAADFRLTFKIKLIGDRGNSGVQFRTQMIDGREAKGYQADVGPGWWGKIYEEHGRGLLGQASGEKFVRPGEWNEYEILAVGSRLGTSINGQACNEIDDPEGAKRGVFAIQLHSGEATEVRVRDLKLEVDPKALASGGQSPGQ